jgi:histone H3/H4
MTLPKRRRTAADVKTQMQRILERALEDFAEDLAEFGRKAGDK